MIKVIELYGLDADQKLICVWCGKPVRLADFKDKLSKKEYSISQLCQTCQDQTFEKDI